MRATECHSHYCVALLYFSVNCKCDDMTAVTCGWLQILTRRLRFRLERAPGESMLIDRTGRNLKMEPLATISSLERHLLKMVAQLELFLISFILDVFTHMNKSVTCQEDRVVNQLQSDSAGPQILNIT